MQKTINQLVTKTRQAIDISKNFPNFASLIRQQILDIDGLIPIFVLILNNNGINTINNGIQI